MPGNKIVRRRNEEAARQGWKCHWCKVPMTPVPPYKSGIAYQPTMVTLDHMFPKGDQRRRNPPRSGERRYVAACRLCNEDRGKAHEKDLKHRSGLKSLQFGRQPLPLEPAS